jgi:putative copper resistance protein D
LIEAGLIAARFLHFAAVMALFGLALFPLYGYPASGNPPLARVNRWLRKSLWCAAFLALASGLAWGWFAIAAMNGSITAADADGLVTVLRETSFGQVWLARLALFAGLLTLMGRRSHDQPDWTIMLLAALLLVSLALVGHTHTSEGVLWVVHISADGAHLLAAGTWSGGLLALAYLLILARRCPAAEHDAHAVSALVRFSGMGYAAVATLLGSGLVNAWVLVGSPERLFTTQYGQLLLVKVCLFAGMLALAAQNRFRRVPALRRWKQASIPAQAPLRVVRRNVLVELALGLVIVLIVGWLGTLPPAIAASD